MSILIAIATAHNSTRDIAQRIATRLATHTTGPIDVIDAADVPPDSIPQYSAVILGSAVHARSWLSPARRFLHTQRAVLSDRPVWAFSVGVPDTEAHGKVEQEMLGNYVRKELPGLEGHVLFTGRVEREHIAWPVRLIFKWFPKIWKFGDFIKWDEVDAWADGVGGSLNKGA
ncbi:Flavodoxin domain-containing protein [Podospora aff. communis PSN243]|uniref:Flavodoxin domain-containing protein n=1 Tax=Podospora aff. communis PSN243 TaxID=3040156 RepID=A0AAV9G9K2_9PEZI|nr:Flavodoxin domain-containing protein [Podospora aff. communis PSN243]